MVDSFDNLAAADKNSYLSYSKGTKVFLMEDSANVQHLILPFNYNQELNPHGANLTKRLTKEEKLSTRSWTE